MIKFEIFNRLSGAVQFTAEIECDGNAARSYKIGLAVTWAIKSGADLSGANLYEANLSRANLSGASLYGADLYGADLYEANLSGANLYEANLSRANLSGADLYEANLSGADLYEANLSRANLSEANLSRANLSGADLYEANLSGANLSRADLNRANLYEANLNRADLPGANLYGADLYGADLYEANLSGANLKDAENADLAIARTRILPEGDLIGWKKCRDDVLVKLRIPEAAKRSSAFGRKCRAEFADVLEVIGADKGISLHDGKTEYVAATRVTPDAFGENWQEECAGGIHFYITRAEAEAN